MSVTTHDLALGIAAVFAFPLALTIPAVLATDGSPDPGLPLVERGQDDPVQPARTTSHQPR
jgi:hypothetical protein